MNIFPIIVKVKTTLSINFFYSYPKQPEEEET